jgi:hypothetical protein
VARANGRLDLSREFFKAAKVFDAPRAGFEVNVYYLPVFVIQLVLHQSHHLVVIQMVVPETEFGSEIDRRGREVSSLLGRIAKQKLAGSAIRDVFGDRDHLRRRQDAGAKLLHLDVGYVGDHLDKFAGQ